MEYSEREGSQVLGIVDAVDTLTDIAEMDIDRLVGADDLSQFNLDDSRYGIVEWLREHDKETTETMIRDIFRIVLKYLRNFYKNETGRLREEEMIEEIKTIMVLAGEAAKKLDRFTQIFYKTAPKAVTESKEFQELQKFYLTRIARKVDEGVLGQWILGLTKSALIRKKIPKLMGKKQIDTEHVFIDLDSVKKDTEYELFFLRKENGTRFFNPRLIRNVKLVCDFGGYIGERKQEDPLENYQEWIDRYYNQTAQYMINSMRSHIDEFYHVAADHKNRELVNLMHNAFMALMLSSKTKHLMKHVPIKTCTEYFHDFQDFLRRALESREYQKWEAYPPKRTDKIALMLQETIQQLCYCMYRKNKAMIELKGEILDLLEDAHHERSAEHLEAAEKSGMLWHKLANNYAALEQMMKRHPNGPLAKVLEVIDERSSHQFDPLMQGNLPEQLYSLYLDDHKMTAIRYPTPTVQELIHKASIVEEFKAFLIRSKIRNGAKHLIFNFQDRTSWREHFRAVCIEHLGHSCDFHNELEVVTLPKDTEFYHQIVPYDQDNHAKTFKEHFLNQMQDEGCGFYFSDHLKKELFPNFAKELLDGIHELFFANKNVLTQTMRKDFIELYYLFLELRILEIVKPTSFCFSCKDALDVGMSSAVQLSCFLLQFDKNKIDQNKIDEINLMLFTPILLSRERLMLVDRFQRMLGALKHEVSLDKVQNRLGTLFIHPFDSWT